MSRQLGVDARFTLPKPSQDATGPKISPPAVPQHPPIAKPLPVPPSQPAWDDLVGQALLLQKSSELEAARQAEDFKRRGLLMTAPDKPKNFDAAFSEVTRGRWINLDEAARQEIERRQRRTPPGWMGDCGDEFSW